MHGVTVYLLKIEADTVHCLSEGVKDDKLVEAVWCFPPKQEGITAVIRARATGANLTPGTKVLLHILPSVPA